MVILGGALLSLLGLADRAKDGATGPQIVFFRALGQTIFFGLVYILTKKQTIRNEFQNLTYRGVLASLSMALAGFFMVMSLQYTLVANAIFIISLTPLIAALLAWLFIKESINGRTIISMVIALIGVGIIFGTSLNTSGVFGMFLALIMAVFYASSIVFMRTIPKANVILICVLSGLMLLPLMVPLIGDFSITNKDLALCFGLGILQVGFGTLFVMTGAKHVPATQVSILALVEVVLSPIWVWLYANEVPALTTLIGGSVVMAGVIYQASGSKQA